ncbi:M23 family metallopeptidase [Thermodesulfobacteriota bacterium]
MGSRSIVENKKIKGRIAEVRNALKQLDDIQNQVVRIRNEERIIREFLGIEAWQKNFDINERMGKGGAYSEGDDTIPSIDLETEVQVMEDEWPLHVRVHSLREDVHELISVLSKMTETLNCRPTVMPVKDKHIWITSGFGWRKSPFTGLREFHKGLDISGRKGAHIIATADGVVKKVGYNRFIGYYVEVEHDGRFSTKYGHMLKYVVKKNQHIRRGEVVGHMGTTGMSTGYHLHYEVVDTGKKVNPYNFILNRHEQTLADARY